MEDGKYIRFRIPCYLDVSRTRHRGRVVEKILELNCKFKLLKFGMNVEDGEVSVEIDLPLEDSQPTPRLLSRCMYCLTEPAMKERENLLSLLETGIYPASEDEGFCASLERLLPDEDFEESIPAGRSSENPSIEGAGQ